MKFLSGLLARALDLVDAGFEASAALWRVAVRGAFQADSKSFRSARFAKLSAEDVLIEEIALNAADQAEAKKAIALDPERTLPLPPDMIAFDVAGPMQADAGLRARQDRTFVLGVVRKEALQRIREASPRRDGIEAFVFALPAQPDVTLVFGDDLGARARRLRRAPIAVALIALILTAGHAQGSLNQALERRVATAEAERLNMERRIRLAERRASAATAMQAAVAHAPGLRLADVSARLNLIALHQPSDSEAVSVSVQGPVLTISGRAYAPDAVELAWRRAFAGEEVVFAAEDGEPPRTFTTTLTIADRTHP